VVTNKTPNRTSYSSNILNPLFDVTLLALVTDSNMRGAA